MSPQEKPGRQGSLAGVWVPRKRTESADEDGGRTAPDSEQGTTVGCAALTPALSATPSASPPLHPSWDWKTDVPEFVPGDFGAPTFPGLGLLPPSMCNDAGEPNAGFEGTFDDFEKALLSSIWGTCMDHMDEEESAKLASLTAAAATASGLSEDTVGPAPGLGEDSPKTKEEEEEELQKLRKRMTELQQARETTKREWESEKRGLLSELERCVQVLERYAIPLEEAMLIADGEQDVFMPMFPDAMAAAALQNLFPHTLDVEAVLEPTVAVASEEVAPVPPAGAAEADGGNGRCIGAMADPEVNKMAEDLEALTESTIDDRAMRAIQALTVSDAAEVFRKVDDLVQQQGGKCRNLSSILQSVCRKRERRSARSAAGGVGVDSVDAAPGLVPCEVAPGLSLPEGSLAFLSPPPGLEGYSPVPGAPSDNGIPSGDVRDTSMPAAGASGLADAKEKDVSTPDPRSKRHEGEKEDVQDREVEDVADGCSAVWDAQRVAKVAQRGFELKQRGDRWELKLSMSSLEPPLTEQGMELYCAWLRARLIAFRKDNGVQPLRKCCGEIDFSGNGLGNQAVWMLLETLAKCEVQAASLKLYKNRISLGGVLALCEFIRANRCAGPVHEMHLSHNEIDEEAALELLRTLQEQKPRYPPRRPADGQPADSGKLVMVPVPVWVRLNQNRIVDPAAALKTLEAEGITYCAARNAHSCAPTKCARSDCPLVHLYLFTDQVPQRKGDANDCETPPPLPPVQASAPTPQPSAVRESRNKHRVWTPVEETRPKLQPEVVTKDIPAVASGDDDTEGLNVRRKRSRRTRQREA